MRREEKENQLSGVRENGLGNFRVIDGHLPRAQVPTVCQGLC